MSRKQIDIRERGKDEATVEFALDALETTINRHELGLEKLPGTVLTAMVFLTERCIRHMPATVQTKSYEGRLEGIKRVQRRWHLTVVN